MHAKPAPGDIEPSGLRPAAEAGAAAAAGLRQAPPPKAPLRLRKRAEFLRVSRGRRSHGHTLTLQALARTPGEGRDDRPRFGLTVTKKTGGAVERNRIRRRLREALRTPGLAAEPGHDYVIVARREALSTGFSDLVADLAKALRDARAGRTRRRSGPAGPAAAS